MNNVIIGAGQCGRGYLARLLTLSQASFTFIDCDEALIDQLQKQKEYKISFCGSSREVLSICDYQAFSWHDPQSTEVLAQADIIFTSIGEQHLSTLIEPLIHAFKKRKKTSKPKLLTAENGTAPKQQLLPLQDYVELSESVIFCTTLKQCNSLDILSEDLDYLPYDRVCLSQSLSIHGMIEEYKFRNLLERKIYTYNALSACVAYLGDYLGYASYGDAANDVDIENFLQLTKKELDCAISQCYVIPMEEQRQFSAMAIAKFANREIIDTIDRNARDVKRKLGMNERIMEPMRLISQYGGNSSCFIILCAAALWYGAKTNTYSILDSNVKEEWITTCKGRLSLGTIQKIDDLFRKFHCEIPLSDIVQEAVL